MPVEGEPTNFYTEPLKGWKPAGQQHTATDPNPDNHAKIHIVTKKPRSEYWYTMGDGAAKLTEGLGGHEIVQRLGQVSITDWTGVDPYAMDVPLLLDGFAGNNSVQNGMDRLRQLGRTPDGSAPPVLRIWGPIPINGMYWTLESIEWGDSVRNNGGDLIRQPLVATFQQFVNPDSITFRKTFLNNTAITGQDQGRPGPLLAIYTVKDGDTLFSIAKHFYHDRNKWHLIAKANDIRDPRAIKKGQKLKVPEDD